jgi:hypothetical protein
MTSAGSQYFSPPTDTGLIDLGQFRRCEVMAAKLNRSEQSVSNSLKRIRRRLFKSIRRRMSQEANS